MREEHLCNRVVRPGLKARRAVRLARDSEHGQFNPESNNVFAESYRVRDRAVSVCFASPWGTKLGHVPDSVPSIPELKPG